MQEQTETVEKAVDCLRIITTGNDANKRALVEIPIALPGLMRLLAEPKAVRAVSCRHCLLSEAYFPGVYTACDLSDVSKITSIHRLAAHATAESQAIMIFMRAPQGLGDTLSNAAVSG